MYGHAVHAVYTSCLPNPGPPIPCQTGLGFQAQCYLQVSPGTQRGVNPSMAGPKQGHASTGSSGWKMNRSFFKCAPEPFFVFAFAFIQYSFNPALDRCDVAGIPLSPGCFGTLLHGSEGQWSAHHRVGGLIPATASTPNCCRNASRCSLLPSVGETGKQ